MGWPKAVSAVLVVVLVCFFPLFQFFTVSLFFLVCLFFPKFSLTADFFFFIVFSSLLLFLWQTEQIKPEQHLPSVNMPQVWVCGCWGSLEGAGVSVLSPLPWEGQ